MTTSTISPTTGNLFEARGLTKTYGTGAMRFDALRGLDLDIASGETVAIVGKSGSGKSTLMHILALLDSPTTGTLKVAGTDAKSLKTADLNRLRNREFGFVFQSFHLLPDFTALENVLMPARIGAGSLQWMREAGKLKERAENLLTRVGLGERLSHVPSRLSGGERQRVALARALVNEPAVVFCDEPTGNLDSKTADEIFGLIRQFNEELGKTFLIVTHDEHIARKAQRHLHMSDGRFVPAG